ncbi:hypothetical protein JHC27_05930 [archaeon]|jgi:hypothetical protein|nr:hypothetical protein [archaeon]NHV05977.1 hypothetical protein [Nitrososphaerota archaeon]
MSFTKRRTLRISLIVACAVLYAAGAYATSYIESPWGMGQFRPAILIPLTFATLFDWGTAAIGGALGTLLADSIKHGQLYIPSLVAAVPGHIVAFFVFGLFTSKKFSWHNFVKGTLASLLFGNFVTAFLYVWFVLGTPYVGLIIGLTAWWYVTMLPFALLFTPPIAKVVASATKGYVREEVYSSSLSETRVSTFLALFSSGLIFLIVGVFMFLYPNSFSNLFSIGKFNLVKDLATQVTTWMFVASGSLLLIISLAVLSFTRNRKVQK